VLTLEEAARLYHIPLHDYGPGRGQGALVAVGSGLMLAVMDQATCLRWAVDTGELRTIPSAALHALEFARLLVRRQVLVRPCRSEFG
jgi:hypothetical protein